MQGELPYKAILTQRSASLISAMKIRTYEDVFYFGLMPLHYFRSYEEAAMKRRDGRGLAKET